jgi:ketosteroid isomerase-like protein
MSASDNITTVKAIYDAFRRAEVQTILDAVADDVDWATEGDTATAPWYGQRTGKDAVVGIFEALGSTVEVHEFTPLSFAANDQDEVHTLIRFGMTSRQRSSTHREGEGPQTPTRADQHLTLRPRETPKRGPSGQAAVVGVDAWMP